MNKLNYSKILFNKSNSKSTNILVLGGLEPQKKKEEIEEKK